MFHFFQKLFSAAVAPRFNPPAPQDGEVIREGIVLTAQPELDQPYFVKFAFTQHPLFKDPVRYLELQPFLPKELSFTAAPDPDLNCFSFVSGDPKKINRLEFLEKMQGRGYQVVQNVRPEKGDFVAYYSLFSSEAPSHAASVCEVVDGSVFVESRWGEASPVLKHPIDQVLPEWMDESLGMYRIFRKLN